MAYSGSTAASSLANPPVAIGGYLGGGANTTAFGARPAAKTLWMYNSSHTSTELLGANFFTDAQKLGMKAGDIVIAACATGTTAAQMVVGILSSVTTAGANLASTASYLSSTR